MNKKFSESKIQIPLKFVKRYTTSFIVKEVQIKNNKILFLPYQAGVKILITYHIGENMVEDKHSHFSDRNTLVSNLTVSVKIM